MTRESLIKLFLCYLLVKATLFVPFIAAFIVTSRNDKEK
jgi:hypothetical protein